MMRHFKKIVFALLISGLLLIISGYFYDVLFAGIPPQDAPASVSKSYMDQVAVSSAIISTGTALLCVGIIAFTSVQIIQRIRS